MLISIYLLQTHSLEASKAGRAHSLALRDAPALAGFLATGVAPLLPN